MEQTGRKRTQTDTLWSNAAQTSISLPIVNNGLDTIHFYDLPEKDRMAVLCWLLLNIRPVKPGAPAAYLASQDIAELASFFTGIRLSGIQVREALLLLAIDPWDAGWIYRVDRESPCAMLAPDGNGGLVRRDRSCRVKSVSVS